MCDESFKKASYLNAHMSKIHDRKTTFNCLQCCFLSPSVRSLQNHMRSDHPINESTISGNEEAPCSSSSRSSNFIENNMVVDDEENEEIFLIQKLISNENENGGM